MKQTITSSLINKLFGKSKQVWMTIGLMAAGTIAVAQTTYYPMSFVAGKGFNADVVADGTPPYPGLGTKAAADTTFDIASSSFGYYLAADNLSVASMGSTGGRLPVSTTVNSLATPAITYTLAPNMTSSPPGAYIKTPTALHQRGSRVDTLLFTNTTYSGDIYLLGASGNGPVSASIIILYSDNTSAPAVSVTFPDWFNMTSPDTAMVGIGRTSNQFDFGCGAIPCQPRTPRLFDIRVPFPFASYGVKTIKGIRIAKTTSGGTLNILAVTIAHNPCPPSAQVVPPVAPPTPPVTITTANTIKWRAVTGSVGYEYILMPYTTMPVPLPILPPLTAPAPTSTTDTFKTYSSGLIPNTPYVFFVRNKCNNTGSTSVWNVTSFTTPNCATVSTTGMLTFLPNTTRSLRLRWAKNQTALTIYTAASPLNSGFEYALTNSSTPPASGTYTTDTAIYFSNLLACKQYYLHVRNNCTGTSFGPWSTKAFITACCPAPGGLPAIIINSGISTNVPGAVSINWKKAVDSALVGYQYQLVTGTGAAVWSDWKTTTDTFVNFPNADYPVIKPGQMYRFWLRSDCTDTFSVSPMSVSFLNPFYRCDTTSKPRISNINIHGAQIDWDRGFTPAPYPIQKYNVAVTLSPVPPSDVLVGDSAFAAHLLPNSNRFWRIDDTFHHVALLQPNTKYYVHVRSQCDTVYRPPYATPPVPIYNYSAWRSDTFRTPLTCTEPVTPTISNITPHSAHMQWNLFFGGLGYEYFIDQSSTDPTISPAPLITYNQVSPANLYSGTNYWFHLRTKCSNTAYSPWTNTPFTTPALCNLVSPSPALQASPGNPGPTSAIFTWPVVPNATSYDVAVTSTIGTPSAPDATVSITSYTATGLTPKTNYYFYMKANCSPNDATGWVMIPFKTDFDVSVPTLKNGVSVLVYPNPVEDNLTVDIQTNPKGTLQVVDMMGKVIFTTPTLGEKTVINMKPFAPGVYMIKYMVDNANFQTIRIHKQ